MPSLAQEIEDATETFCEQVNDIIEELVVVKTRELIAEAFGSSSVPVERKQQVRKIAKKKLKSIGGQPVKKQKVVTPKNKRKSVPIKLIVKKSSAAKPVVKKPILAVVKKPAVAAAPAKKIVAAKPPVNPRLSIAKDIAKERGVKVSTVLKKFAEYSKPIKVTKKAA